MTADRMLQALVAKAGGVDPPPEFHQFARFVGSWSLEAEFFEDGDATTTTADWHFASVLGGRALQDVLIFPAIESGSLSPTHRIGTSLRFYDTDSRLWRVVWISPQSGTMYKLSGGADGQNLVLNGDPNDGEPTKWIFEDITDESFTWRGLVHDGNDWRLVQLMKAKRATDDARA